MKDNPNLCLVVRFAELASLHKHQEQHFRTSSARAQKIGGTPARFVACTPWKVKVIAACKFCMAFVKREHLLLACELALHQLVDEEIS
jgi:hypothetical protein